MKAVQVELPDTSASVINELTKADKDKLAAYIQFWAYSLAKKKERSALEIMHSIQAHAASQNLSEQEMEDLLNESLT